jgi:hypothetical protein
VSGLLMVVGTVLLKRLCVLVFTGHGTRRPRRAGVAAHPAGAGAVRRPPDTGTQPVRDVADLRPVRRKPVVAGVINEYHHTA